MSYIFHIYDQSIKLLNFLLTYSKSASLNIFDILNVTDICNQIMDILCSVSQFAQLYFDIENNCMLSGINLYLSIYISLYMCVCAHVCIYVCVYKQREAERRGTLFYKVRLKITQVVRDINRSTMFGELLYSGAFASLSGGQLFYLFTFISSL